MKKLILIFAILLLAPIPLQAGFKTPGGTTDEYWHIADNAVLDNPDSDWTWAFMWKINSGPGATDRRVFSNANDITSQPAFIMYCSTTGPGNIAIKNNGDVTGIQTIISSGQECNAAAAWQRVIIEHTGNTLRLYLNNVSAVSGSATVGASSGPAGGLYWGNDPDLASGEGAFEICDVARWTRLLSSDERASLNVASAAMFSQSQTLFVPAVRDPLEIRSGIVITLNGATVSDCPSFIRPS